MWANFHMHSDYCDGKGALREYLRAAQDAGMLSVGCSSHAPVSFPCVWCMKTDRLQSYLHEVDTLKRSVQGIELYKGLEIDYVPGIIAPTDLASRLDYTIGSVHFVDTFTDGQHWEIDGLHTTFLDGLDRIFNGDIRRAIARYYALTREMVLTARPDIVGHLDKIKIQNTGNKFYSEEETWYQEEIDKTIDAIAESKSIVEVNTRGLYQGKSTTPYPSPWILERLYARRIPVTISSDAHHPSDITNRFVEVAAILRDVGYKYLSVLFGGRWQSLSFDLHGINR